MLLTAWSLLGCYAYVPVKSTDPAPASGPIRVVLGARGTESVQSILGENIRRIDGQLSRSTADSLYLRAESTQSLTGLTRPQGGIAVTVARADLLSVDVQRTSKRRSWLMAGVIIVVAIVLGAKLGAGSSGTGEDGPTPTPL